MPDTEYCPTCDWGVATNRYCITCLSHPLWGVPINKRKKARK